MSDNRREALEALLVAARNYEMTEADTQAQRESWVKGMTTPCEHGVLDFETCADCRAGTPKGETP